MYKRSWTKKYGKSEIFTKDDNSGKSKYNFYQCEVLRGLEK